MDNENAQKLQSTENKQVHNSYISFVALMHLGWFGEKNYPELAFSVEINFINEPAWDCSGATLPKKKRGKMLYLGKWQNNKMMYSWEKAL